MLFINNVLLVLGFFIFTAATSASPPPQLVAVFVVLRHGDRAPTDFAPNDPFADPSYWTPNGIGELNSRGIERMQAAGRLYRELYAPLLDATSSSVAVRSSTRNRSVESVRFFLEQFLEQSINVTDMIQLDGRMLTTTYPCPRADAARLEFFQSQEVLGYMESKRDDILRLQQYTGDDYFAKAPYTLRYLEFLATTTEIERDEYLLDVANWIRDPVNIATLTDLKRHAFLFNWKPRTVQKYRVGVLLGDIRDHIRALASGRQGTTTNNNKRFHLYSTHDVNQVLLFQALDQYDQVGSSPTTYSSANVFELYQQPNSNTATPTYLLRSLYREVEQRPPFFIFRQYQLKDRPLKIAHCKETVEVIFNGQTEQLCTVEQFEKLLQDKVPVDYEAECKSGGSGRGGGGLAVLGIVTLLSIIIFKYQYII